MYVFEPVAGGSNLSSSLRGWNFQGTILLLNIDSRVLCTAAATISRLEIVFVTALGCESCC